MVFKPIAPAKMSMARDTTASFLDIYASGDGKIPKGTVTLMTGMSRSPRYGSVPYWYTPARPVPSPGFRLVRWGRTFTNSFTNTWRIGFSTYRDNGTVVLSLLGL
jgi:hypothetical protein